MRRFDTPSLFFDSYYLSQLESNLVLKRRESSPKTTLSNDYPRSGLLLDNSLLTVYDVDASAGNLLDATTKDVVDDLLTTLGVDRFDGVYACANHPSVGAFAGVVLGMPDGSGITPFVDTCLGCIVYNKA